jgi:hypothetical protein
MSNSPKITHFEWGTLHIEGYNSNFKDAKLYPGGAREWDWTETGTQHTPGIQVADVQEIVEQGAEVMVLSKGVNERLQTQSETLSWLAEQNVTSHVLQTEEAIDTYNKMAEQGKAVGALIHSTC